MCGTERWKAVKGYAGRYEVSDQGRVRSLNYSGTGRSQVLKSSSDTYGYLQIQLCKNGNRKMTKVHALVLEEFVSPRPPSLVCDHIDANRANNRVENLEWVSVKENTRRGRSSEMLRLRVGSKHPNAKLSEKQVVEIRLRYAAGGVTQRELGREYGIHRAVVSLIVRRKRWKHVA